MQLCLFGEVQLQMAALKGNSKVSITESEKSAVLASVLMPQYVWMAAGALGWLSVDKLKPLKERDIILYPDTSKDGTAYAKWSSVATEAKRKGYSIAVSDLLESKCTPEEKAQGYDLADYLINSLLMG